MKYVFASVLVLLALVFVFNPESARAVPRTLSRIVTHAFADYMPFGAKVDYAASCIDELKRDRNRIRYQVSDTAVNIGAMEQRIADLEQRRREVLSRIKALTGTNDEQSQTRLARAVGEYERLDSLLVQRRNLRDRMASTLDSLAGAESQVCDQVTGMADRLEMVKLDHVHNDARELAARLADADYPAGRSIGSHCAEMINGLEHEEHVREDLHDRFGPEPVGPEMDIRSRAETILRDNGC